MKRWMVPGAVATGLASLGLIAWAQNGRSGNAGDAQSRADRNPLRQTAAFSDDNDGESSGQASNHPLRGRESQAGASDEVPGSFEAEPSATPLRRGTRVIEDDDVQQADAQQSTTDRYGRARITSAADGSENGGLTEDESADVVEIATNDDDETYATSSDDDEAGSTDTETGTKRRASQAPTGPIRDRSRGSAERNAAGRGGRGPTAQSKLSGRTARSSESVSAPAAELDEQFDSQLADEDSSESQPRRTSPGRLPIEHRPARSVSSQPTVAGVGRPGDSAIEGSRAVELIVEKIAPDEVQVAKPAVIEIRIKNSGTATAQRVEVHDEVPQGAELVDTQPRAEVDGSHLVWSLGSLAAGAEVKVHMELIPREEGEIGSVATVQFATQATSRSKVTRAELSMEVRGQTQVMIGEETSLVIRVTNTGTGPATGVVLAEVVPDELEHAAGPELEYEVGTLAPGETRDLNLALKARSPGRAVNLIEATGEGELSAEAEATIEVVAPALEVHMQGPKRRYLERQATYTLEVANPGTAAARDVELVTYLPRGLDFVSADNQGQYDPQSRSVRWSLEELPAKDQGKVTLVTLPVEAGEHSLRVEGRAELGLSDAREEAILVEGVAAIVYQVVDLADPIEVGGETTYEIRVVNQGSKDATGLEVVAELPEELEPVDAEGPTNHEIDSGTVSFEPLSQLAPKAETTYRVRARGVAEGDLRIKVQLRSDDMQRPVVKEESTQVYSDDSSGGTSDDSKDAATDEEAFDPD